MTMLRDLLGASALALGLMACTEPARQAPQPTPVAAPAPPAAAGVADLGGTGRATAERELTSRSYRLVTTRGTTQYWWSDQLQDCVRAVVSGASLSVVQQAPVANCSR